MPLNENVSNAGAIIVADEGAVKGMKMLHFTIRGEDRTLCDIDLQQTKNKIVKLELSKLNNSKTFIDELKKYAKKEKFNGFCGECIRRCGI